MSNKIVSTTLLAMGIGKYQADMTAAAAANTRFGASAVAPSARAKTMQTRMTGLASATGLLNPALLGPAGAVLAVKSMVSAAIEWESAFAGVIKTVDGTDAQLAAISDGLRGLSTEIPVTAEGLAGVAEAAGQLGIETGSVLDFTRVMADLGVATNMSADEAATSLARLANITQMPQTEFDRLGSTVVDLGNNLATTEAEIVEMSLRLAGAGNQAGFTEAEILGLSGALSSVGIRAEAGGTAFSKVMIEISEAAAEGGEQLGMFADVAGMSAEAFAEMFREDPAEAIIRFVEGLGGASDAGEDLFGILKDLGIEEIRMRDALLRTAGAGDVLRDAVERGNGAWEENIALTTEAEQRYETTASQIQLLKNNVKDASRALGEDMKPALDGVLGFLNDYGAATQTARERTEIWESAGISKLEASLRLLGDRYAVGTGLLDEMSLELRRAEVETDRLATAAERSSGMQRGFKQRVSDSTDAVADQAAAVEATNDALEAYVVRINAASDPLLNLRQSIADVDEAQEAYNDAVAKYGTNSQEATDAAYGLLEATNGAEGAALDADLSFRNFNSRLDDLVSRGLLTEDAAAAMRGELDELRGSAEELQGEYFVTLTARDQASPIIANVIRAIGRIPNMTVPINVAQPYGGPRADGGPVSAGRTYLVGEEGPELWTASQSGTIVPADRTASMMGGGSQRTFKVTQNFNVRPDPVADFRSRESLRTLATQDAY